MEQPAASSGRIALTKAHLATDQAQEFVAMLMGMGSDGEFTDIELGRLSSWLGNAPSDIPAVCHLRELVFEAVRDGVVTDSERRLLHKQIERVLPPADRERLAMARRSLAEKLRDDARSKAKEETAERQSAQTERASERVAWKLERQAQRDELNRPSDAQLRYIAGLGGSLPANATRAEASALIDQILNSNASITPRQTMVLRFWGQSARPDWGRRQVSTWMDEWYSADPDRQLAWEKFKEESGDNGTAQNPERVPVGVGMKYLQQIKGHGTQITTGSGRIYVAIAILTALGLMVGWYFSR